MNPAFFFQDHLGFFRRREIRAGQGSAGRSHQKRRPIHSSRRRRVNVTGGLPMRAVRGRRPKADELGPPHQRWSPTCAPSPHYHPRVR